MEMMPMPGMRLIKKENPAVNKEAEIKISKCNTFGELYDVIRGLENIPGSAGQSNKAENLIIKISKAIIEIKKKQLQPNDPRTEIYLRTITRTGGLRQKVTELIFNKE